MSFNRRMNGFQRKLIETKSRYKENTSHLNSASVYISNIAQNRGGSALLLIDPQYDFIEGSLAVPGAKEDCVKIAKFIRENITTLQNIYVTLDSHMNYHIAHPTFWVDRENRHPKPFTKITHDDVLSGKWRTVHARMMPWAKQYTKELEKPRIAGIQCFTLTIWPEHCRIGTRGHNVDEVIQEALKDWELKNATMVHYILKGNNSKTEHFSAFRAEVEIEEDPGTQFNYQLYNNLMGHTKIYVAGEAKSHCVNFTVRDLVGTMGVEKAIDKVVLLGNGMSSVPGCEKMGDVFIDDMMHLTPKKGLTVLNIEQDKTCNAFGLKATSVRKRLVMDV